MKDEIMTESSSNEIPFFRPFLGEEEIEEVVACLRSGWLTTGPRTRQFEAAFAQSVGANHAVAVNSCTAALHLALEAMNLRPGQAVLVPTMTFAATAEVVHYQGAEPLLVDCDPVTLHMDLEDAQRKLDALSAGRTPLDRRLQVVGMIPVHVGGQMMDVTAVDGFASRNGLWVIEDAAHAFPAAFRSGPTASWRRCGGNTAAVTCFSFYANKTITTGEGGMAVTADRSLADRMRQMSLHGLSHQAWNRYCGNSAWDYRIVAPGYKYNLTDIAASVGIHQLRRAESLRLDRQRLAYNYLAALADVPQLELPAVPPDRIHAWHLFPVRLRLEHLSCDRDRLMAELRSRGIGCSVHWRPLHLHPHYEETVGWKADDFPAATAVWRQLISLPLFPGMRDEEQSRVVEELRELCRRYAKPASAAA